MREDGYVLRGSLVRSSPFAAGLLIGALAIGATACTTKMPRCTHTDLHACSVRCTAGHGESCAIAAYISDANESPKAIDYFLKGCAHGYAQGCYAAGLGSMLRSPRNLEMAARAFEAGCQLEHLDSCAMRSAMHELTSNENPSAAFAEYDRTCAAGSAVGCSLAGDRLVAGRHMKADEALGLRFLERACDLGESSACERVEARQKPAPTPPSADAGADGAN